MIVIQKLCSQITTNILILDVDPQCHNILSMNKEISQKFMISPPNQLGSSHDNKSIIISSQM